MNQVPRIQDMTGKPSQDDLAAKRDWDRARSLFHNDKTRHPFGSPKSKEAWLRRTKQTRSF